MKITIMAEGKGREGVEVFVNAFMWNVKDATIMMTHGIADGYYSFPVKTDITPIKIEYRQQGVIVSVASQEDVGVLAEDLKRDDEWAMKSFERMYGV